MSMRLLMLGPVNHPHVEHLALAMHERGFDVIAAGNAEPTLPASVLPAAGIPYRRGAGAAARRRGGRARPRAVDPAAVPRDRARRRARALALRLRGVRGARRRLAAGRDGVGLGRASRVDGVHTLANRIALRGARARDGGLAGAARPPRRARRPARGAPCWSTGASTSPRSRPANGDAARAARAARARPGPGDPEPALADAGLQPGDDPRRVRARARGAAGRAARAQAHGSAERRAGARTRPRAYASWATSRTSRWRGTTRPRTSACRSRRPTARRDRSGRRWRAAARSWSPTCRGCES